MNTPLLSFFIVALVLADGTITEQHVDLAGTHLFDKTKLLTRVEKKVDVNYQYVLSPTGLWTQFPDMAMEFNLDFAQYVDIKYNINTMTSAATFFCTRFMLDNGQKREFRITTGNGIYHTNFVAEQVWLEKGRHFAKVQYRTPSNQVMPAGWDFITAFFKIRYFKL